MEPHAHMALIDFRGPCNLKRSRSATSDRASDNAHAAAAAADSTDFDGMVVQPHADELPQLIRQAVALYVSNAIAAAKACGSAEQLFAVRTVLETRDFATILKGAPEYAFLSERWDLSDRHPDAIYCCCAHADALAAPSPL
jgi:hypothetical protein